MQSGTIENVYHGNVDTLQVQIIHLEASKDEHVKAQISDGKHYMAAILPSVPGLEKFKMIQISEACARTVNGIKTICVDPSEINLLQSLDKIQGNPLRIDCKGLDLGLDVDNAPKIQSTSQQAATSQEKKLNIPFKLNTEAPQETAYVKLAAIKNEKITSSGHRYFKLKLVKIMREFSWNKPGGSSGRVQNCRFMDTDGVSIQMTFFGGSIDKISSLTEGNWYQISNVGIKDSNPNYSIGFTKDMNCNFNTVFVKLDATPEEKLKQPELKINPTKIAQLKDLKDDVCFDLMGIIYNSEFVSGTAPRRVFTLYDDSFKSIRLTLWGDDYSSPEYNACMGKSLIATACRFNIYNGTKTVKSTGNTLAFLEHEKAKDLKIAILDMDLDYTSSVAPVEFGQVAAKEVSYDEMKKKCKGIVEIKRAEADLKEGEFKVINLEGTIVNFVWNKGDQNEAWRREVCTGVSCRIKTFKDGACMSCGESDKFVYHYNLEIEVMNDAKHKLILPDHIAKQLIGLSAEEMVKLQDNNIEEFKQRMTPLSIDYFFTVRLNRARGINGKPGTLYRNVVELIAQKDCKGCVN